MEMFFFFLNKTGDFTQVNVLSVVFTYGSSTYHVVDIFVETCSIKMYAEKSASIS